MENIIKRLIKESIETKKKVLDQLILEIQKAFQFMLDSLQNGKKILVCGNGGSAADAQHFAAELVVRFEKDRMALPALALTTNTSSLTACSNDLGYKSVFARQVEAIGEEGDVLVGITTSGNSPNIIEAFEQAKAKGMIRICLNGSGGGQIKTLALDSNLIVPSDNKARVQEAHVTIIHVWCHLIENSIKVNSLKK